MCRSVADAALLLTIISGPDTLDDITLSQPSPLPDYMKALNPDALRGARLGVPRLLQGSDTNVIEAFNASIAVIKQLGAIVVDPAEFQVAQELRASEDAEMLVLHTEFKVCDFDDTFWNKRQHRFLQVGVNKYISGLLEVPTGVKNVADVIAFNTDHADEELIRPFYDDQSR